MYTNIYTHRSYRGRRREIDYRERPNKLINSAEQRHRAVKLYASGMHLSQIAHQLDVKRKTALNLIRIHQYGSLPRGLERAFRNAKSTAPSTPLFVVFDRSEWQPSESSMAASGYCSGYLAA